MISTGPLIGLARLWGIILSQHQQAFLADTNPKVDRFGQQVLGTIASNLASQPSLNTDAYTPHIKQFYDAAFAPDLAQFNAALHALRAHGVSEKTIAFDVVPFIARKLGAAWEDDIITFADVTIGCSRLQSLLRRLSDDPVKNAAKPYIQSKNCLVAVPQGAQHTLGAVLLATQLRHAGIRVSLDVEMTDAKITTIGRADEFDAVMISASQADNQRDLHQLVMCARQKWPKSKVFIGGGILDHSTDIVSLTGADAATNNWQAALDLCI